MKRGLCQFKPLFIAKMTMQASKWSFISLGFIIMAVASWKHFYDLLLWSQEVSSNYFVKQKIGYREFVNVLQFESNCGLRHSCSDNSFPIFLSTGDIGDNQPKLCVSGKYIIRPKFREDGRGLNAAVVETKNFEVVSVRNFDTYLYNKSAEIAEWIDGILDDDILIIFTSDEASSRLSGETKSLLNDLGSGKIQNLQYRSQWYMITQKRSEGFTTYEKITYSKKKSWGEPIEFRGCIPKKIPKKITTADEPLRENQRKVQFCSGKRMEKYKGFCNEPRFEIIMPALLTNKTLVGNPVFSLPIFLFASSDLEIFISAVDNLIHQPGISVSLITILYEKDMLDVPSIAKIYGMHSNKTKFKENFKKRLIQAREMSVKLHPKKKHLIVLDLDVLPSPDFLFFFAQTFPILEKDKDVLSISAWCSNCYNHEGSVHLVYRIRGSPKHAALILADKNDIDGEMFAPDVPRVQGLEACHTPSLEPDNWIKRPQDLQKDRYYHKMIMLQQLGYVLDVEDVLTSCSHQRLKNETNVIYIQAKNKSVPKILDCLGIRKNHYGTYDGIIRFLELGKNDYKTSTQIGLPYRPARTDLYEKLPPPKIPIMRWDRAYEVNGVYTPSDGLKTTYDETFKVPAPQDNLNFFISRLPNQHREYSKLGKNSKPMTFGQTEYKSEFPPKELPPTAQGISVEKTSTCPMIMTGRDEREPLPLTENFYKYLDIYVSTSKLAHRPFTLQEQRTIAMKDIVTSQETMDIPKGRGFGCKYPPFAGQDLDKRDKNMVDKVAFKTEAKPRIIPRGMPKVPNFGSESETKAAYTRPEGYALPHLFDRFTEFPQTFGSPAAKQTLCPPGMYTTESYAINKHTSPQTVV